MVSGRKSYLDLIVKKLREEGLSFDFADAQAKIAQLQPDVVTMDFNMPRMNGLETLQTLRADPSTRTLPIIMLTSSVQDRDIIESYDCGANSYVRKPVDFARFADAIKQLQLYWLVLNEQPTAGK